MGNAVGGDRTGEHARHVLLADHLGEALEIAGERHAARASLRPLYDPGLERVKC